MQSLRLKRKIDHIALALKQQGQSYMSGFSQVDLLHNCITEVGYNHVSLSTNFLNKDISYPIIINAITGGPKLATNINIKLAQLAKELSIPMAVGSQTIALKDSNYKPSFSAIRRVNPKGIFIANLSAKSNVDSVCQAVDMLQADAIQLHLNPAQEMVMHEGDREFSGLMENIVHIKEKLYVPIIIKEVGCGISYSAALELKKIGIKIIDIAGLGGTNFTSIEGMRKKYQPIDPGLYSWGIPTAYSLAQVSAIKDLSIIAGGGINRPLDIVKALSMGADYVSMAGLFLNLSHNNTLKESLKYLEKFIKEIKIFTALTGAKDISSLRKVSKIYKEDIKRHMQREP